MNKRFFSAVFVVATGLLWATFAHAEQGCPPGQTPHGGTNMSTCGPIPGQQPAEPTVTYYSHWGALAVDSKKGIIGTQENADSERHAKKDALSECTKAGGTDCILAVSYVNGCVAMATGDSGYGVVARATIEAARDGAMAKCERFGGGCHIYHDACNVPSGAAAR
jgi:hypothetical protein